MDYPDDDLSSDSECLYTKPLLLDRPTPKSSFGLKSSRITSPSSTSLDFNKNNETLWTESGALFLLTESTGHMTSAEDKPKNQSQSNDVWFHRISESYFNLTFLLVIFLVTLAFPLNLPSLVLIDVDLDQTRTIAYMVCSVTLIISLVISPFIEQAVGVKWSLVIGCAGVTVTSFCRCFNLPDEALVFVLALTAACFGPFLLGAWLECSKCSFVVREGEGYDEVDEKERKKKTEPEVYLSCELNTMCLLGAPALSVFLQLILVRHSNPQLNGIDRVTNWSGTVTTSSSQVTATVTQNLLPSTFEFSEGLRPLTTRGFNSTKPFVSFEGCGAQFHHSNIFPKSASLGNFTQEIPEGSVVRYPYFVTLLVCSVGALLIAILVIDSSREGRRSWKEWMSVSCLSGNAENRRLIIREMALLFVLVTFAGCQQMFFYLNFIEAFVTCTSGPAHGNYLILLMTSLALILSPVIGYLLRYTGRLKLAVAMYVIMTSLLMTLLLVSDWSAHVWPQYMIGCVWSVADCALYIIINAVIILHFSDIRQMSLSLTFSCRSLGQLIVFITHVTGVQIMTSLICLLVFLLLSTICYVSLEISLKLHERWERDQAIAERRVKVSGESPDDITWLPKFDPSRQKLERVMALENGGSVVLPHQNSNPQIASFVLPSSNIRNRDN